MKGKEDDWDIRLSYQALSEALARQSWQRTFAAQRADAGPERRWLMRETPAKGSPRHERETTQCDVGSDVPGGGAA